AELQKQRDDLERERQKLAAQAKASSSAGADRNTSSAVTSAGEAPATPAKAKIRHIPARIELNTCAAPRYPNASRQLNEEGRVVIGYQIDEYGKILNSRIDTSSGSPRLDTIAMRAMAKCTFKPGTANGIAETSWTQVAFTWKLDN
ncbi:MAG TPA: energy transducer TonB, partial [Solimonas sp.]